MKLVLRTACILSAAFILALPSCKKETPDTDTTSATDNSLCEGEFNRVVPAANGIAIGDPGVNDNRVLPNVFANCPEDSIDPADTLDGWPITLYLKYGSTGCTGSDGKVRKGTLRCVFDTAWDSPNPTMTMYLDNYYVNDIHFEGTITVTKNTQARTFTQTMTNGRCSKSDWDISYQCTRSMTWTAGYNTVTDWTDDVFEFNGSASGVDRNGTAFNVTVTTPIEKRGNCQYITKGVFELVPDGKSARIVDFGDGTCDNRATLKIGNSTFNFTLQ